jgi:hypothetical protein
MVDKCIQTDEKLYKLFFLFNLILGNGWEINN